MIYLDNGATSFRKPEGVLDAVGRAVRTCASPGRGGYGAAVAADRVLYGCREAASALFDCKPEQVVLTTSCTHGLNIAVKSLLKGRKRVVISGFEHNAVVRPLYAAGAEVRKAGRRLFDREEMLEAFAKELKWADMAVFTHVSNVFGYILPVEEMAALCREKGIPFVVDAAQSAGILPVSLEKWGASFIAMPGHKGLLGMQGTGILVCAMDADPILYGGTGSDSLPKTMPEQLPERLEAGTMNVPGYAGLKVGLEYIRRTGTERILERERRQACRCARGLKALGMKVFEGEDQTGTVSFLCGMDCQEAAQVLARQGIAVRAGLHCAPCAHESAGTLDTGTIRVSFGHDAAPGQTEAFLRAASKLPRFWK